ncbi:hypothetical protein ACHAXA_002520 [Cyclostephanos tholiformis]|jgi:hypothetical protein|uniref:Uncharacterized protein n=1 Tax=Cyclostephanos tholiformis TaxID=382380 RepID=A0ABD3SDV1_9STRA
MKTRTCFINLAILAAATSFVRTSEAGGGRSIAWNDNPHRRFGMMRRATANNEGRTRRQSFVVSEQYSPPSAEVTDAFIQDESQSQPSSPPSSAAAVEPMMEAYHPGRILADGARAAAVAFVSAAAIGGARHAIEMIGV